jgi:hypothetical protein
MICQSKLGSHGNPTNYSMVKAEKASCQSAQRRLSLLGAGDPE